MIKPCLRRTVSHSTARMYHALEGMQSLTLRSHAGGVGGCVNTTMSRAPLSVRLDQLLPRETANVPLSQMKRRFLSKLLT